MGEVGSAGMTGSKEITLGENYKYLITAKVIG